MLTVSRTLQLSRGQNSKGTAETNWRLDIPDLGLTDLEGGLFTWIASFLDKIILSGVIISASQHKQSGLYSHYIDVWDFSSLAKERRPRVPRA